MLEYHPHSISHVGNIPSKWVMNIDKLAEDEDLSWAANHASCNQEYETRDRSKSLSCLLPLFYEDSKSVAMLRHGMDIVKNVVDVLNPGQVSIITADQPLYALCKQIQWRCPGCYGEDHFIVIFGGLHIKLNALKVLGDLFDSSGWTGALTQANIASSGTADSYLKVSHVTHTRHAHRLQPQACISSSTKPTQSIAVAWKMKRDWTP